MPSFRRYCVKKPRKATALLRFFLVPTKIWHFKTAKHWGSFSFCIVGCFFDASILSVLQGEKRPRMWKIKLLGRVGSTLLCLCVFSDIPLSPSSISEQNFADISSPSASCSRVSPNSSRPARILAPISIKFSSSVSGPPLQ